jgi:hypothetical protein
MHIPPRVPPAPPSRPPVVTLIALVVGWRKRTVRAALLAGAVPIAWVLLIGVIVFT